MPTSDESFQSLTYQLPMVGYWPTLAVTGNGELGFDSGEGAQDIATTSKEGSRRANYPILCTDWVKFAARLVFGARITVSIWEHG